MIEFLGLYNYWIVILLMMAGFYIVMTSRNLVKKIIGLNIFQASVFLFYISMGKVAGGSAPIIATGVETYSNPLPHVLILTAIVVGVATTALGLALIVRLYAAYGSIEENDIDANRREERVISSHLPVLQVVLPLMARADLRAAPSPPDCLGGYRSRQLGDICHRLLVVDSSGSVGSHRLRVG